MDPCSKTIELLAIEYPMKLEVLKSCVLPNWPEKLFFFTMRSSEIQMLVELAH